MRVKEGRCTMCVKDNNKRIDSLCSGCRKKYDERRQGANNLIEDVLSFEDEKLKKEILEQEKKMLASKKEDDWKSIVQDVLY